MATQSSGMTAHNFKSNIKNWGFPGGSVVQKPSANVGDTGLIPGPGRFYTPQSKKAHELQL